jgi:hypothetical protein
MSLNRYSAKPWRSSCIHVKADDGVLLSGRGRYFTVMLPIMYWWMLQM